MIRTRNWLLMATCVSVYCLNLFDCVEIIKYLESFSQITDSNIFDPVVKYLISIAIVSFQFSFVIKSVRVCVDVRQLEHNSYH